jgi:hypothetical protein
VPSFPHEFLVDLFRGRGELAPALLDACAGLAYRHDRVEQTSIDLSQVVSTEYRADAVVVLHKRGRDAPVAAIIVEVQLNLDRHKKRTWPVYVAALRAKLRCPVVLLVLTPDRDVAIWARKPIDLGHPGFSLAPVVIELADVPRVTEPSDAQQLPELAILSAMAHPELEVATAAISAIPGLPEDQAKLYWDVVMAALPHPIRKILEARMKGYVYQSDFARKYYFQGHEEGLVKGREEGREEGRERGLAEGQRRAVIALLAAKLEAVTDDDQAVIEAIQDASVLTALIGRVARATSAAEIHAALTAAATATSPR